MRIGLNTSLVGGAGTLGPYAALGLLSEASFYADFQRQIYGRGDASGINQIAPFEDVFDFSRATIGYATPASGTLTEYAIDVPRFEHDPLTGAREGLKIEQSQTNLLTYSEDLSNAAWAKSGVTVTADAIAAPDGAITADKIVETSSNSQHFVRYDAAVTSGNTYTLSVYVKADERSRFRLELPAAQFAANDRAIYNLDTASVDSAVGGSPTITHVGGGFYKLTLTGVCTSSGTAILALFLMPDSGTSTIYTGDGTSGIYVWGAGLVTGPYAGSHIPTGAATATRAADLLEVKPAVVADVVSATAGTIVLEATVFNIGVTQNLFTLGSPGGAGSGDRIQINMATNGNVATTAVVGATTSTAAISSLPFETIIKIAVTYSAGRVAISANGSAVNQNASATLPTSFDEIIIGNTPIGSAPAAANFAKVAYVPRALTDAELQAITS